MTAVIAIPARLKSTRFPRKVLADIHGKPMLWHVYQAVAKSRLIDGVWVLTDSTEVLEEALSWGANALMTSENCPSGTARIASVLDQIEADIIVNVQGDEPLIKAAVVDTIITSLEGSDADVATPVYRIAAAEDVVNPNVVKVVRGAAGEALYFSRSAVPHVRDAAAEDWLASVPYWGHVGLYGYRRRVLQEYPAMPEGVLENAERLEQLRLLEAGKKILTVEIDYRPVGVDVPADLEKVRTLLDPSLAKN